MVTFRTARILCALSGFGFLALLGWWFFSRLILGAEVEESVQRVRFIHASALLLPAVVLSFMTVRPAWTPRIDAPAAKYQVPALLAGLWFVVAVPLALVLGV